MRTLFPVTLLLVANLMWGTSIAQTVHGQNTPSGTGITEAWNTHVHVDPNRGQLEQALLHVGRKRYFTVYRVKNQGHEVDFSEQAYAAGAGLLAAGGAQARAEQLALELRERGGNPVVETIQVPEATIYVQSSTGTLQALNAHTGHTIWSVPVGRPFYPSVTPAANDDYVVAVAGTSLTLLKAENGEALYQRSTAGVPAGAMAIDSEFFYLPTITRTVEGYRIEDRGDELPWRFAATGIVKAAPVPVGSGVQWASDSGHYYWANARNSMQFFRAEVGAPIVGGPVPLGTDKMILTSSDGLVHAFDRLRGGLIWRQAVGDDIDYPAVCEGDVYVATRRTGLLALSPEAGQELWHVPEVTRILSVSPTRVYGLAGARRVMGVNRKTGQIEMTTQVTASDFVITNALTDRIYVGSRRGQLTCYHEQGLNWPSVHLPQVQVDEKPQPRTAAAAEPSSSAAPASADTTPPATPGTASPFGEEGAEGDAADGAAADESGDDLDEGFDIGDEDAGEMIGD